MSFIWSALHPGRALVRTLPSEESCSITPVTIVSSGFHDYDDVVLAHGPELLADMAAGLLDASDHAGHTIR
jgi:hypothetical protein